jgi:beta-lactamase regulating signal transducer with metallopeptidase domain
MAHGHHHGEFETGKKHEAIALDPEHDIDARSATLWVVGGAIATFFCLWLMVPIFVRVLDHERVRKIDLAPTTELHDVRDAEREFLAGGNPQKKNIDAVIESLRKK